MLRVLACDSAEVDKIGMIGRHTPGGGGGISPAAQRLFGLPSSSAGASSSSSSGSGRTCQDVRYPVNLRNERRAMEILLGITSRVLSAYPTSLAQDDIDLADEVSCPKFSNRRNARLQVRGEKEVLNHFASWARTAMHVIDIILHELEVERVLVDGGGGGGGNGKFANSRGKGAATMAEELGYDYVVRAMEEDDDCHSTILRYCTDVLGAVRREEFNRIAAQAGSVKYKYG
jgi:hypothetical protein